LFPVAEPRANKFALATPRLQEPGFAKLSSACEPVDAGRVAGQEELAGLAVQPELVEAGEGPGRRDHRPVAAEEDPGAAVPLQVAHQLFGVPLPSVRRR